MSHAQKVLNHLKRKPLTRMEAFKRYDICELSARIIDLERAGWVIPRRTLKLKSGKRVTEYMGARKAK